MADKKLTAVIGARSSVTVTASTDTVAANTMILMFDEALTQLQATRLLKALVAGFNRRKSASIKNGTKDAPASMAGFPEAGASVE